MATRTLKATVFYTADKNVYTFPFDYLQKKFVKAMYISDVHDEDEFDNSVALRYGVDYTITDKELTLKNTINKKQNICIYRQTPSDTIVDFIDSSVLRAKDLNIFDIQKLHLNEELSDYVLLHSKFFVNTGGNGDCDNRYRVTVEVMQNDLTITEGDTINVGGYYIEGDGGKAEYVIINPTEEEIFNKPWLIRLDNGLYAEINEKEKVNYKQFGAYLDGEHDDGKAMLLCHKYADSIYEKDATGAIKNYLCKVENHQGIIYKKNTSAINCSSDVDLSGSTLLIDDTNAAWFGIYVWGDVGSIYWDLEANGDLKNTFKADTFVLATGGKSEDLKPNTVIKVEETPYSARDDAGYLYTVGRKELLIHDADGICSSPFADDWVDAGGVEINCKVSGIDGVKTEQTYSKFSTSFTYVNNRHGKFTGCDVVLNMSANKYCCVLWVKHHNAIVENFIFRPNTANLHNTAFKNAMIYIWNSYNVTVRNLQGFNASGKKLNGANGTSGYMLRMTNVSDVYVEDCRMQGYWGATAMGSVKNVYFKRCHLNRLDTHDYYYNLFADECTFYNHSIQIGYGRGITSITNCNFYYNPILEDSYPSAHMLEFNLTYGRMFEGKLYIDNCRVYLQNPYNNEFNIFKMTFSPNAVSITRHFRLPEITCKNVYIHSDTANTSYAYFKIAGSRRGATSDSKPSHVYNFCTDNTTAWLYIGRGVEWGEGNARIEKDSILRVMDSFIGKEGKTQFYNRRYYICTQSGQLDFSDKPNITDDKEFMCGTAKLKYYKDALWCSKKPYKTGDVCATSPSNFYPLYIFECIKGGVSNGYYPTHKEGTVLDGVNDEVHEPDACWWTYITSKEQFCIEWSSSMEVMKGQRIIAEGRMYEVTKGGILEQYPPYITVWFEESVCGTANLKFIGQSWAVRSWYQKNSFCEANGNIYQLVKHDGITSGVYPTQGSLHCVDGDIIWKYITGDNLPSIDDSTFAFKEEIVFKGDENVWIDTYTYNIPAKMTKLKMTIKGAVGGINIKYVTSESPYNTVDTKIKFNVTNEGKVIFFEVPSGKKIRPVLNYWGGTVDNAITVTMEGNSKINMYEATATLGEFKTETAVRSTRENKEIIPDTWKSNTPYNLKDTVISNGNTYECAFDGKLELPNKTIFENITTNMDNGNVFWFFGDVNVPTKRGDRDWKVIIKNCEGVSAIPKNLPANGLYFGHDGNPNPVIDFT